MFINFVKIMANYSLLRCLYKIYSPECFVVRN